MKALCLIDLQNDFIDGSMGVGSNKFNKAWDNVMRLVKVQKFDIVAVTMDYHPKDHCSFRENGGEWPAHCVQGSGGVRLNWKVLEFLNSLSNLKVDKGEEYPLSFLKGQDKNLEEYGVNLMEADRYSSYLARSSINRVTELHIAGLCTDYCVKNCALETARCNRELPIVIHTKCSVAINPQNELTVYEYKNIKVTD